MSIDIALAAATGQLFVKKNPICSDVKVTFSRTLVEHQYEELTLCMTYC
jgi:hypothetical protein